MPADLAVKQILEEVGASEADIRQVYVVSEINLYLAFSKGTSAATVTSWQTELEKMKDSGSLVVYIRHGLVLCHRPLQHQVFWHKAV